MSDPRPWRILDLIEWTTGYFERQGIRTARLDAELLLAHALGQERLWLYLNFSRVVSGERLTAYRELVRRRAKLEPVAYLTGTREFYSLPFKVNPHVLIPRPETERLVETAIERLRRRREKVPVRVADVGTGCGAIGVALAVAWTAGPIEVVATDISPEALDVARENATINGVAEKISFFCGHLLSPLAEGDPFDAILSNPPYVPTADFAHLQPDVAQYEPRVALDGGRDGLDVIRQLIRQAPAFLVSEGWLAVEVGDGQAEAVAGLFDDAGAYSSPEIVHDYAEVGRVVVAART